jgi:hypothetical protein
VTTRSCRCDDSELFGVTRSTAHYKPQAAPAEDLKMMRLLDAVYFQAQGGVTREAA